MISQASGRIHNPVEEPFIQKPHMCELCLCVSMIGVFVVYKVKGLAYVD